MMMRPDDVALGIMWSIWGLAVVAVALAVVVNRLRNNAVDAFLTRRSNSTGGEGGHGRTN